MGKNENLIIFISMHHYLLNDLLVVFVSIQIPCHLVTWMNQSLRFCAEFFIGTRLSVVIVVSTIWSRIFTQPICWMIRWSERFKSLVRTWSICCISVWSNCVFYTLTKLCIVRFVYGFRWNCSMKSYYISLLSMEIRTWKMWWHMKSERK